MDKFSTIKLFKQLLNLVSIDDMGKKIQRYRAIIENENTSEKALLQELKNIFSVTYNKQIISFFLSTDILMQDTDLHYFFRIRKFNKEDKNGIKNSIFHSIKIKSDVWSRPAKDIEYYGRLNRPGQSVLYISNSAHIAIHETKCQADDYVFLLVYRNMKPMRISQIHVAPHFSELSGEENIKRAAMHQFLKEEFTRPANQGEEHVYRSSVLIYEQFFNSPFIDGFGYPSTKRLGIGYNLAFTESKAEQVLKFVGLFCCRLKPGLENAAFNIEISHVGFLESNNTFSFYPVSYRPKNTELEEVIAFASFGGFP